MQSEVSAGPSSRPLRASMTAVPWSPMGPLRTILSPGRRLAGDRPGQVSRPTPEVLIYTPWPWPRSTTLVSPVTTDTPQAAAVSAMEATMAFRSAMGRPSSRMRARLRYFGVPPHMARSLTVPHTASLPMSPPGKKMGSTTKLSVEKTRGPDRSSTAPSPRGASRSLRKAGSSTSPMSWAVREPPLP